MSSYPRTLRSPCFTQVHRADPAAARQELLQGLSAAQASTSPKYLYDRLGSRLFEAITELPEYYPTRTEAAILDQHGPAIAAAIGPVDSLVDLGAGNCSKAMRLFALLQPARYVAVDISVDFLREALRRVQCEYPDLEVHGIGQDFSDHLALPEGMLLGRPVYFYPGSSIGNFAPAQARQFLAGVCRLACGGGLLIGVDLVKPVATLEAAYDDALGVTAAFNLNLLLHLNQLIGSDFVLRDWRHIACYNQSASRIEMVLEARRSLRVGWPGGERHFAAGERIQTEHSYKYTLEAFEALLAAAGFIRSQHWTDRQQQFAVYWATAPSGSG